MNNLHFPTLFSPIKVGNMTVKNRIFMSPMGTALCSRSNQVTDEAIAYYEARAKGGVGLITTETVMMDETCHYFTPFNMGLYHDDQIPGMKRLTDAVHSHGTKIVPQLLHGGPAAVAALNDGRTPRAASPIPLRNVGEIPLGMTIQEIHELTIRFGDAALRARKAGMDGVEVHSCHRHGILGTFLSPLSNKRVDEYGGNIDGRMLFLLEVIKEIQRKAGEDFPIIVRLSLTESEPGGQSLLDAVYIAKCLEKAGVSMLHFSNGSLETFWKTVTPSGTPKGVNTELSEKIKQVVQIPVGVVGRNNEPWAAELVLSLGRTDVTYMGRALLCDPEFPNKAMEGRVEDIRPCIGCTDCINHVGNMPLRCSMNPAVSRETAIVDMADKVKKVLVLGGGPAGLQAAATAAERGHHVTLLESSEQLGGQMYLAAFPISKQDISHGVKYLIRKVRTSGVDIRTGTAADIQMVKNLQPDAVVLATGGEPMIPQFLTGAKQLVSAWDVLAGRAATGQNIAVIGGGAVGCETADFLVHPRNDLSPRGKRVTVIEMADKLLTQENNHTRTLLVERMIEKGCVILLGAKVDKVENDSISYTQNDSNYTLTGIDTVVSALGTRSVNKLADEIGELGIPVYVAGDAANIGKITDAILSAQLIAETI